MIFILQYFDKYFYRYPNHFPLVVLLSVFPLGKRKIFVFGKRNCLRLYSVENLQVVENLHVGFSVQVTLLFERLMFLTGLDLSVTLIDQTLLRQIPVLEDL